MSGVEINFSLIFLGWGEGGEEQQHTHVKGEWNGELTVFLEKGEAEAVLLCSAGIEGSGFRLWGTQSRKRGR